MRNTQTEENYLKTIYHFEQEADMVSTNSIAHELGTSPASVTDMVKKLNDKGLVIYKPYHGTRLTEKGRKIALSIIRKHRLWEVFLVEKLNFSWEQVHEVAEQLEHIHSPELIRRLDTFLGYPKFDPHGDPIPTESGEIQERKTYDLVEIEAGETVTIAGVNLTETSFLQYLNKTGLVIGTEVIVLEKLAFDDSIELKVGDRSLIINGNVSRNLLVLRN